MYDDPTSSADLPTADEGDDSFSPDNSDKEDKEETQDTDTVIEDDNPEDQFFDAIDATYAAEDSDTDVDEMDEGDVYESADEEEESEESMTQPHEGTVFQQRAVSADADGNYTLLTVLVTNKQRPQRKQQRKRHKRSDRGKRARRKCQTEQRLAQQQADKLATRRSMVRCSRLARSGSELYVDKGTLQTWEQLSQSGIDRQDNQVSVTYCLSSTGRPNIYNHVHATEDIRDWHHALSAMDATKVARKTDILEEIVSHRQFSDTQSSIHNANQVAELTLRKELDL
jgi:hypothetical protein